MTALPLPLIWMKGALSPTNHQSCLWGNANMLSTLLKISLMVGQLPGIMQFQRLIFLSTNWRNCTSGSISSGTKEFARCKLLTDFKGEAKSELPLLLSHNALDFRDAGLLLTGYADNFSSILVTALSPSLMNHNEIYIFMIVSLFGTMQDDKGICLLTTTNQQLVSSSLWIAISKEVEPSFIPLEGQWRQ